jgi:hypothetical protein
MGEKRLYGKLVSVYTGVIYAGIAHKLIRVRLPARLRNY